MAGKPWGTAFEAASWNPAPMKKPSYKHVVPTHDPKLRYTIYAYRQLTRAEIVATIQGYRETKFERPREGSIEIVSMIGFTSHGSRQ